MIERFGSTAWLIPLAQLLAELVELLISDMGAQKMYPGKFGEAKNEMSGERRLLGEPGGFTVCQEGFGYPEMQAVWPLFCVVQLLAPPPVDEMPISF